MPSPFDHAFALFLVLLFPIRARSFGYRRLQRAEPSQVPRVRRSLYREAMLLQWGLAAVVLAAWAVQGRSWASLGVVPRFGAWAGWLPASWQTAFPWGLLLPLAIVAIALGMISSARAARDNDEALAQVRRQLRNVERLMPEDDRDLRAFYALSLTAGICEELLFRGYLLAYLAAILPPPWAIVVSSVAFGLGHLYQGVRGIVKTTLAGLVFALVTIAGGSILPAAALHAAMDAYAGTLARAANARERSLADTVDDAAAVG